MTSENRLDLERKKLLTECQNTFFLKLTSKHYVYNTTQQLLNIVESWNEHFCLGTANRR